MIDHDNMEVLRLYNTQGKIMNQAHVCSILHRCMPGIEMWVQLIDIEVSMSIVQLQVCHGGYRRVC